jgi:hypothetical protein
MHENKQKFANAGHESWAICSHISSPVSREKFRFLTIPSPAQRTSILILSCHHAASPNQPRISRRTFAFMLAWVHHMLHRERLKEEIEVLNRSRRAAFHACRSMVTAISPSGNTFPFLNDGSR